MITPRLVAFDLDETLAPSKQAISPRLGRLLSDLLERVEVAIISGAPEAQLLSQVVDRLDHAGPDELARLHLLPACGTRYLRHDGTRFLPIYAHDFSESMRDLVTTTVHHEATRLGLWSPTPWGDIIEHRGSQITFSALGQDAPRTLKQAWDPDGRKRRALRDALAARLPDLEVRLGGSTSIDLTHSGIDKAFGVQALSTRTGVAFTEMLFFGDRLEEGGNDYPVRALGVPSIAVRDWEDTARHLDALLQVLPPSGSRSAGSGSVIPSASVDDRGSPSD